jgi:hypothetical protein
VEQLLLTHIDESLTALVIRLGWACFLNTKTLAYFSKKVLLKQPLILKRSWIGTQFHKQWMSLIQFWKDYFKTLNMKAFLFLILKNWDEFKIDKI